ncbi:PepSY-associated TM helix domain-containing protein [Sphingobium boeckii]|uniref:Putative iron-regulated membrane protein n=1 Tax=Sphingobium boeckii TaxID=1082345 RepID=A0A7W9AJ89_9SPHN|nr:PepSY domain-containing protein [Sphingobium boeckii]MBB5686563.1 putative iron-regulated membrane protein [Sphingobium boeckii]
MSRGAIRAWYLVHKWTSIVCTLFLLMLCVTGLPLIFHHEIDELAGGHEALAAASDAPLLSLDRVMASALERRPGEVGLFLSFDEDRPVVNITTGPRPDSPEADMYFQSFDRVTGDLISAPAGEAQTVDGVMHFILQLHTDMFLGLPGMLFLGLMGLLFFVAIVSGVVLYAPFMRKLDFGTVRVSRSRRVKWLDYHNLLGIVSLAWASVVGVTGVINTLATPIIQLWQASELAEMTGAYRDQPPPPPGRLGSINAAVESAKRAAPGNRPQFVAFPGGAFSSKHHYAVFLQGDTPLTKRMLTPALIDAQTGVLTDIRPLPWYVQALLLSQPLHFGDYGALPLKILWALLDLATIVVLGSGLYLWLGKRRSTLDARVREVETGGVAVPAE